MFSSRIFVSTILPFCRLDDVDETLTGVDDRDDGSFSTSTSNGGQIKHRCSNYKSYSKYKSIKRRSKNARKIF